MFARFKMVARTGVAVNVSQIRTPDMAGSSGAAFSEVRLDLDQTAVLSRTHAYYLDAADGDELIVVGFLRGEELWSMAWYNRTRKTGYEPSDWFFWPGIFLLAFCLAGSIAFIFMARNFDLRALALVPLLLMLATQVVSASYRQQARKLIREYKSEEAQATGIANPLP